MEENNNFLYKGYLLVIGQYLDIYIGFCKELDYTDTKSYKATLLATFKNFVDKKLEEKEKEMIDIIEYKDFQLKVSINGDYLLGRFVQKDISDIFARSVEELSVPELRKKFRERVDFYLKTEAGTKEKVVTEDNDKKIAELVKEIAYLNSQLKEK